MPLVNFLLLGDDHPERLRRLAPGRQAPRREPGLTRAQRRGLAKRGINKNGERRTVAQIAAHVTFISVEMRNDFAIKPQARCNCIHREVCASLGRSL